MANPSGAAPDAGIRRSHALRLDRLRGLYAIVGDEAPVARAQAVIEGGAAVVQVRMKRAPDAEILEVTRRIVAVAQGRALVLVNDRPDLALLAGADGVHVGEEDEPTVEARALLGPARLVGRTVRGPEDAAAAVAEGADHVGLWPVFPSGTKPADLPPLGLAGLAACCRAIPVPVVAISGIALEHMEGVARAGAACAAVIGDLFNHGDPRARAALLAAAWARGAAPPAGGPP